MAIQFDCSACGKKVQAPENAVGKKVRCPHCQGVLQVPDPVYEAEEIAAASPARKSGENPAEEPSDEQNRIPCPLCGEMIVRQAAKCRFCGEIFDATLKRKAALSTTGKSEEDSKLTTADIVIAFVPCLSAIGCIFGLLWIIQGKPKGLKMLGLSFLATFFWGAVNGIWQATLNKN